MVDVCLLQRFALVTLLVYFSSKFNNTFIFYKPNSSSFSQTTLLNYRLSYVISSRPGGRCHEAYCLRFPIFILKSFLFLARQKNSQSTCHSSYLDLPRPFSLRSACRFSLLPESCSSAGCQPRQFHSSPWRISCFQSTLRQKSRWQPNTRHKIPER